MPGINRPIAGNYNVLQQLRNALSDKTDSVFSYRNVNPYSAMYDQFKKDNKPYFNDELWQQAANKGELDQYVHLLHKTKGNNELLENLTNQYGARVDYDTMMLALAQGVIEDDKKEDRFDAEGNLLGNFTQKELIEKVIEEQRLRWDAEILQEAKLSDNFFMKISKTTLAELGGLPVHISSSLTRWMSNMGNIVSSGLFVLTDFTQGRLKTIEDISKSFAQYSTDPYSRLAEQSGVRMLNREAMYSQATNPVESVDDIAEKLQELAMDIKRKYSMSTDAVTGEQKYWGKILTAMGDSLGYMLPSMVTGQIALMYVPRFMANTVSVEK